ncbi:MAG: hypothetical protein ISP90_08615 [Nevskia sp.]|nr:hypothetical protein [Nevskia sp.]
MKRWGRMCQVREVLAGGRTAPGSEAFCASVMSALAQERATARPGIVERSGRIIARPARRASRRWQPLLGLAAAASIASVAVVGARHFLDRPLGAAGVAAGAAPSQVAVAPAQVQPAAVTAGSDPDELRWAQLDADTAGQLNEFVIEHSNLRAGQGMGGSLSYARMINTRTVELRAGAPH